VCRKISCLVAGNLRSDVVFLFCSFFVLRIRYILSKVGMDNSLQIDILKIYAIFNDSLLPIYPEKVYTFNFMRYSKYTNFYANDLS
ncbi:hypothetical protein L9F63_005420, partial [Diploptera punctata]